MRGLSHAGALAAALALAVCAGCRKEPQAPAPSRSASPPAAPATPPAAEDAPAAGQAQQSIVPRGFAGPLPPLPDMPYPPARPPEVVRAVYAFAARTPEVLHYIPCFCGCERHGHRGNDDCFVAGRGPDGKPRWEMHGYV